MLKVQHAEISIMRASFIFTHQPGRRFHFMDYILASMDDDIAKVSELLILLAHNKVHWVHSSYSPLTPWGGGRGNRKEKKISDSFSCFRDALFYRSTQCAPDIALLSHPSAML
jgi:hypothetical protein